MADFNESGEKLQRFGQFNNIGLIEPIVQSQKNPGFRGNDE